MSQHELRLLRAAALAVCLVAGSGFAAAAPATGVIRLSQAQVRAAGIQVEAARPAADAVPAERRTGLRLAGRVVTPGNKTGVILSAVAGHLETVYVHIGAAVRAGEPLAQVYSADLPTMQRSYLHAKATAELASSRLARDQALFDEGIIAESRLRESQATLQMARATQQEQRRLLSLAGYSSMEIESLTPESISPSVTLRAHGNGVVLDQAVQVGQHVEPGATLFRLGAPGEWWLELEATKRQAGEIRVGDLVRVEGCSADGRVIAVGTQFRASSQTLPIRVQMQEGSSCLRPNQYIEADVLQSSASAKLVSVPAGALVRNDNREYVFVQKAGGFEPAPVAVERHEGARVLLKAGGGVQPGTRVASSGLVALKGAWLGLGPQQGSPGER